MWAGKGKVIRGILLSRQPEWVQEGAAGEIVFLFLESTSCAHAQRNPPQGTWEKRLLRCLGTSWG